MHQRYACTQYMHAQAGPHVLHSVCDGVRIVSPAAHTMINPQAPMLLPSACMYAHTLAVTICCWYHAVRSKAAGGFRSTVLRRRRQRCRAAICIARRTNRKSVHVQRFGLWHHVVGCSPAPLGWVRIIDSSKNVFLSRAACVRSTSYSTDRTCT